MRGYTPLESIALGVPAITSDLSGFGSYLHQLMSDQQGVQTVRRREMSFHDAAEELSQWMLQFTHLKRRERITLRNSVENFATHFDWHNLVKHYHAAHELALARIG